MSTPRTLTERRLRLAHAYPALDMLGEHKAIVAALHTLVDAAQRENQMAYAHFAEKLMLHAQTEEEVFYPTAILIGEYMHLKLDT